MPPSTISELRNMCLENKQVPISCELCGAWMGTMYAPDGYNEAYTNRPTSYCLHCRHKATPEQCFNHTHITHRDDNPLYVKAVTLGLIGEP